MSLTARCDYPEDREPVRELLEDFLDGTGWNPDMTLPVTSALKNNEYSLITQFVIYQIPIKTDGDTDTFRDYEYTDSDNAESFAVEFGTHAEE